MGFVCERVNARERAFDAIITVRGAAVWRLPGLIIVRFLFSRAASVHSRCIKFASDSGDVTMAGHVQRRVW